MNKFIFILSYCLLLSYNVLYSNEYTLKNDSTTIDSTQQVSYSEISFPKFDIHLSCINIFLINVGIRALVLDNISLVFGWGFQYGFLTDYPEIIKFGANYHFPFWNDLASSFMLLYWPHARLINNGISGYTFKISYIPLNDCKLNFNAGLGLSLEYFNRGLLKDYKFFRPIGIFELGLSFSFP